MIAKPRLTELPAWQSLLEHRHRLDGVHMRDLFAAQSDRGERFSVEAAGIFLDYSKNILTDETEQLLLDLARATGLESAIEELFRGAEVNATEHRPALHTALRGNTESSTETNEEVARTLAAMTAFAEEIRSGSVKGSTGKAITDVVNLGIGGSDLGPRLVVDAFTHLHANSPKVHFVASIDSAALAGVLSHCSPYTTLFLLSSKSFSTLETLTNASAAKNWLVDAGVPVAALSLHFAAMTSNIAAARNWGVEPTRIFGIGEWVGGRFSLWSAIGLPIAIAIGANNFRQLLAGARAMDNHFRSAALARNLPVLMGLLSIWAIDFWGCQSRAVLPYIHNLRLLPEYLQQLVMESLGKCVSVSGLPMAVATGPVIWGSEGTNGQHSFHQLLLQGSISIPVDFILTARPHCDALPHRHLVANCLAQSRALMVGKVADEARAEILAKGASVAEADFLAPYRAIAGNRPSNTLMLDELTPTTVGALLALYEHCVYVQSAIWSINAFDQWGVEIGKQLGTALFAELSGEAADLELDSSSRQLLKRARHTD